MKRGSFLFPHSDKGVTEITLSACEAQRILLLGPNGSGKSTLLSLLAGRRKLQEGSLSVLGRDAFDDTSLNAEVTLIGPPWPPEAFFESTVDSVASPAADENIKETVASILHLRCNTVLSTLSSGEKRRVQLLCGLLRNFRVILLDECSTDLDVAERRNLMSLVTSRCNRGACCIFATHILDGLDGWATHVAYLREGRLVSLLEVGQARLPLNVTKSFEGYWIAPPRSFSFVTPKQQSVSALSFDRLCYTQRKREIFRDLTCDLPVASRVLLAGCNGSGKTTLLRMAGGRLVVLSRPVAIFVEGKPAYESMSAFESVAFGGEWWTAVEPGEVYVGEILSLPLTQNGERVRELLGVSLDWDVRFLSAGERKRVQLLFSLQYRRRIVLLDEATADLDSAQRYALLQYLYEESLQFNVTVVYATHIFEGLEGWATHAVLLDSLAHRAHQVLTATPSTPINLSEVANTLVELKKKWWEAVRKA